MKYAVIFGAKSYEHEISIVSAIVLKNVIKNEMKYIFCDDERNFYLIEPKNMRANYFAKREYKSAKKLFLSKGGFYTHSIFGIKKQDVDVYINMIHGMDGEDGRIAGLLEFYGVKFIGPRLEAGVLSFSKELTKYLALKAGVKTLKYQTIKRDDKIDIPYPFILKPLRLGSSIGVSVVSSEDELQYALDVAFEFDNEVLIEPFISGVKEYNLAGCRADGEYIYSIVEEPKKDQMLDFDQKYLSFSNDKRVARAEISTELELKLKDAFAKIYDCGFDGALIRCDFFVIDGEVYLNEVNPNPGSMANYLFDDFRSVLDALANSLPKQKNLSVKYEFLTSITHSKGGKV